jgi:hypothetical protein
VARCACQATLLLWLCSGGMQVQWRTRSSARLNAQRRCPVPASLGLTCSVRCASQRGGKGGQNSAAPGPRRALRFAGACTVGAAQRGRRGQMPQRDPMPAVARQWAAFGPPALRQWVAAGDAAVVADAATPAATASSGEEAPVRAAAAARRRYGAFTFAGPDAAADAPPTALRGCSIDLSGPKARAAWRRCRAGPAPHARSHRHWRAGSLLQRRLGRRSGALRRALICGVQGGGGQRAAGTRAAAAGAGQPLGRLHLARAIRCRQARAHARAQGCRRGASRRWW